MPLTTAAQIPAGRAGQDPIPVTLTIETDRVRFTTRSDTVEWRLEVTGPHGDLVFKAIQEQQVTIDRLAEDNAVLKARLIAVERMLADITVTSKRQR